jgi:hypothetical protein
MAPSSYDRHDCTFCVSADIDYVISAVRRGRGKMKGKEGTIISVKQHRLYGNSVGQAEEASHEQVISNIDAGMVYYTATLRNGRYVLGEKVVKYVHGNTNYIRVDTDKRIASDSLGSLPTF